MQPQTIIQHTTFNYKNFLNSYHDIEDLRTAVSKSIQPSIHPSIHQAIRLQAAAINTASGKEISNTKTKKKKNSKTRSLK